MIRRSPAENYIKYLLLHPEGYTDEDIQVALQDAHLDYPGDRFVSRLRRRLRPPKPFYPMNPGHHPSFMFLVSQKLHKLFHPDDATAEAFRLLESPEAKKFIEAMYIVREPEHVMARRLEDMGIKATERGLKRYQHIFWNLKNLDSNELYALISSRPEAMMDDDSPMGRARVKAYKRLYYNDPRMLAISAGSRDLGAMAVMMRMGYMPDKIQVVRLLKAAQASLASKLVTESAGSGPQLPAAVRDMSVALRNVCDMLTEMGSATDDWRRDMQILAMETDGTEVLHYEDLPAGELPAPIEETAGGRSY